MHTDKDFATFKSGATHFEPAPKPELRSELTKLGKLLRSRRYESTQAELEAGKRRSDAIMGESRES